MVEKMVVTMHEQSSQTSSPPSNQHEHDPARAHAAYLRWRAKLGSREAGDAGAALDRPDRRLTILKIFGETRRLADLCMTYPGTAQTALMEGASPILADAARQLTSLSWGLGDAQALHGALTPIKDRTDIAIAIAVISGNWQVDEAATARTDIAERICETALAWLIRGAVKRGELNRARGEDTTAIELPGVFMVAGGRFAHQEIGPLGPLELVTVYDPAAFDGQMGRGQERVLIRIGAEFREAIEGRPGDYALYTLKTPFGTKVNGAGLVESGQSLLVSAQAPQNDAIRRWLATSRLIAGDRTHGGRYLEELEAHLWNERPLLSGQQKSDPDVRQPLHTGEGSSDDRAVPTLNVHHILETYSDITQMCRLTMGRNRPLFRTCQSSEVIETAANNQMMPEAMAARLQSGLQTVQLLSAFQDMMTGCTPAKSPPTRQDTTLGATRGATRYQDGTGALDSLSMLMGFDDKTSLERVVTGIAADAESALQQLLFGPRQAFERYAADHRDMDDPDKLETLGFINGGMISSMIEGWSSSADTDRFSEKAPGLLTAFSETQYPNEAIKLFDQLIGTLPDGAERSVLYQKIAEGEPVREHLVNAFGCFPKAVLPLAQNMSAGLPNLLTVISTQQNKTAKTGDWLSEYRMPDATAGIEALGIWRQTSIAAIAYDCAAGRLGFDEAADLLCQLHWKTLQGVFESLIATTYADDQKLLQNLSLFACVGEWQAIPGDRAAIGFIHTLKAPSSDALDLANEFAKDYIVALGHMGSGLFGIGADLSRRPGGDAAPLVSSLSAWQQYICAEAIAYDQISLARTKIVAGKDKARDLARSVLRDVVANPRRTTLTLRDLDRARSQYRMRATRMEASQSVWDCDLRDGTRRDIELMIKVLFYRHGGAHPFIQETSTKEALTAMAVSGLIDDEMAQSLIVAREFWMQIGIAKAFSGWANPELSPVRKRFGDLLARACGVSRFDQTGPMIRGYTNDGNRLYGQIVLGREECQATVA